MFFFFLNDANIMHANMKRYCITVFYFNKVKKIYYSNKNYHLRMCIEKKVEKRFQHIIIRIFFGEEKHA